MSIAICSVTGRIAGDADACGDCDPCLFGAGSVPDAVKRLLAEKEEWRQKYSDLCMEVDQQRPARADASQVGYGGVPIDRSKFISGDCPSCQVFPDDAWCTSGPGCVRNKLEESKRA